MHTISDIHQQFAEFFPAPAVRPYAYLLSRALSEGSICLNLGELEEKRAELPQRYQESILHPSDIALVAKNGQEDQPFVLQDERLYLQRYFRYESKCLDRILSFLKEEKDQFQSRKIVLLAQQELIRKLFPESSIPGPDWQLAAAVSAVLNNFSIITGGPGTGKTTTVARLLAILYQLNPEIKVALAAPTGKAAARMAESLRNNRFEWLPGFAEKLASTHPSTIHRLLRTKRGTPYFQHNSSLPLKADVVIVDEASMIDVALFAKLLDAIGPETRLILLGDKDQLASVEAGSIFGDLCFSADAVNGFPEAQFELLNEFVATPERKYPTDKIAAASPHPLTGHIVELQYSHRFASNIGIGVLSRSVLENDPEMLDSILESNQVKIDPTFRQELFKSFVEGYESYIIEKDIRSALKKFGDLRVLCATREGPQGLYALNKAIEAHLHDKKWIDARSVFYEHRPIILTRNYYEHGLFNGDTGILRLNEDGNMMAWFEDSTGELKAVAPGFLSDAETAFTMTIHKSQGSEFADVMMVLPKQGGRSLLTRELLYTGITRAKKRVLIQSTDDVFRSAMSRRVQRASGIAERLLHIQN
jgi:exodeoxyribonuclease V alpha subunit